MSTSAGGGPAVTELASNSGGVYPDARRFANDLREAVLAVCDRLLFSNSMTEWPLGVESANSPDRSGPSAYGSGEPVSSASDHGGRTRPVKVSAIYAIFDAAGWTAIATACVKVALDLIALRDLLELLGIRDPSSTVALADP